MKNIIVTIDDKSYKLMYGESKSCKECSLNDFCSRLPDCTAYALGGQYFVELNIKK